MPTFALETSPDAAQTAAPDPEAADLMKVLRRYRAEITGKQRPDKLATLVEELAPLGFTPDWVELHQLALSERKRLSERVAKLPEVDAAWREAFKAKGDFYRKRNPLGPPQTPEERAAYEAPALAEQRLFCERGTLLTERDWLAGLEAAFPHLFGLQPQRGSLGLPPLLANKAVEILGPGADGPMELDIPPQPDEDEDELAETPRRRFRPDFNALAGPGLAGVAPATSPAPVEPAQPLTHRDG